MNTARALRLLTALGIPLVTPADAAAVFGESQFAASKTLSRLRAEGHLTRVRHGQYWVGHDVDRLRLPELLTAPMPSYVSMQSALHLHGIIEQIPTVVYVATLGRGGRIVTTVATFSVHHLAPEVFGGFDERDGAKIASVEKALFDMAYLSAGLSRRFTHLPEMELPRPMRWDELRRWIARTPSARAKTLVSARLHALLGRAGVSERTWRRRGMPSVSHRPTR